MEVSTDKSKLYEVAKCVTTVLVVLGHVARMYSANAAIPAANNSALLSALTGYIYIFHMPLFVMLSGCVFGYCVEQNKYSNVRAFIKNKGKRLLIPYLFFGVCYVAPVVCAVGLSDSYGEYILDGILLGYDSRHLWYIFVLFWIFVLYILLKPLFDRGTGGMVATCCISLLLFLIHGEMPDIFRISSICNYQLFFFAGILFNRFYHCFAKYFEKACRFFFIPAFALMGMFFFNPNSATRYGYTGIGILMVLLFCGDLLQRCPRILENSLMRIVRRNLFSVYLFHPMIIYVLFYLLGQYAINPILLSFLVFVTAITLSIGMAYLVRRVKLHWIIGENG